MIIGGVCSRLRDNRVCEIESANTKMKGEEIAMHRPLFQDHTLIFSHACHSRVILTI